MTARETFRQLVARMTVAAGEPDAVVEEVSLSAILAGSTDVMGLIGYLKSLGLPTAHPNDLLTINGISDEEEVSAHVVSEGVALGVASHGAWVLFRP